MPAAAIAYGVSILTVLRLATPGTAVPQLGHAYYATMGAGLAMALIVIGVTLLLLPLLKRLTSSRPEGGDSSYYTDWSSS